NIDKEDEAEHSFHYHFPISTSEINNKIIIVDEASMISATYSKNELFTFGTGNLLNDLLTFSGLKSSNSKIIFVGDPAQLPPVTDNKSLALDASYLTSLEYTVEDTEMKQVMRQDNNLILVNATKIRELLNTEKKSELRFNYDQTSFFKIRPSDIIEKFVELFPVPEIGNGVIISYSNAQCFHYNTAIRERIFPDKKEIEAGDLLLICNNNYHTYGLELYNGDFAKVVEVSSDVQLQSAPVQNKELNQKVN
ncbi:MAG: ATP-dependent exodnase, partial [Bacteroidota bacterium]